MFYQFYKQPFENNLLAKGWTKTQPMEGWNDVKMRGL